MKIVVIDGQGGRIGSLVTARLCKEQLPNCELYAIGTNATATAAMLKAGADFGATGENPVLVACRDADFIIGPLGILSADSRCNNHIIGTADLSVSQLIDETISFLKKSL